MRRPPIRRADFRYFPTLERLEDRAAPSDTLSALIGTLGAAPYLSWGSDSVFTAASPAAPDGLSWIGSPVGSNPLDLSGTGENSTVGQGGANSGQGLDSAIPGSATNGSGIDNSLLSSDNIQLPGTTSGSSSASAPAAAGSPQVGGVNSGVGDSTQPNSAAPTTGSSAPAGADSATAQGASDASAAPGNSPASTSGQAGSGNDSTAGNTPQASAAPAVPTDAQGANAPTATDPSASILTELQNLGDAPSNSGPTSTPPATADGSQVTTNVPGSAGLTANPGGQPTFDGTSVPNPLGSDAPADSNSSSAGGAAAQQVESAAQGDLSGTSSAAGNADSSNAAPTDGSTNGTAPSVDGVLNGQQGDPGLTNGAPSDPAGNGQTADSNGTTTGTDSNTPAASDIPTTVDLGNGLTLDPATGKVTDASGNEVSTDGSGDNTPPTNGSGSDTPSDGTNSGSTDGSGDGSNSDNQGTSDGTTDNSDGSATDGSNSDQPPPDISDGSSDSIGSVPDISTAPAIPGDVPQDVATAATNLDSAAQSSDLQDGNADDQNPTNGDNQNAADGNNQDQVNGAPNGGDGNGNNQNQANLGNAPANGAPGNPGTAAPSYLFTSGSYYDHYHHYASSQDSQYYLDVTVDGTFGTSQDASGATVGKLTGTETIVSWWEVDGFTGGYNDSFSFSWTVGGALAGMWLGIAGGAGYDLSYNGDVGVATGWNYDTWSDTASLDAWGTFTGSDGSQESLRYSADSHLEETDTNTTTGSPQDPGGQTTTSTTNYDGSDRTDWSVSDQEDNLPGDTTVGDNHYPNGLQGDPVENTTIFYRWFDAGTYSGNSTVTTTSQPDGNGGLECEQPSGHSHSEYDGDWGSQFYYHDTLNDCSCLPDGTTRSDDVTWLVDQRQQGHYEGHYDVHGTNIELAQPTEGFVSTYSEADLHVLTDHLEYTDVAQSTRGNDWTNETFKFTRNLDQPAYFKATYSRDTEYDGSLWPTSDIQTSSWEAHSKVTRTASDLLTTKYTVYASVNVTGVPASVPIGTVNALQFSSGNETVAQDVTDNELADFVEQTGHSDQEWHFTVTTGGLAFAIGAYKSNDGSGSSRARSFSSGSGTWQDDGNLAADYNENNKYTDGTYFDHSEGNGSNSGWVWWQSKSPTAPTVTSNYTFSSAPTSDATIDLTYNGPDDYDGSWSETDTAPSDQESTTTAKGSYPIVGGATETDDDYNHQKLLTDSSFVVNLAFTQGDVDGDVTSTLDQNGSFDGKVHHNISKGDNGADFHGDFITSNSGTDGAYYTVEATFTESQAALTYVSSTWLKSSGSTKLDAGGTLADNAGHTGSWRQKVEQTASVDDWLTNYYKMQDGAWKRTDAEFSLDHRGDTYWWLIETDNGLGRPDATLTGTEETVTHTLLVSSYNEGTDPGARNGWAHSGYKLLMNGSSDNFSFDSEVSGNCQDEDTVNGKRIFGFPLDTNTFYARKRSGISFDEHLVGTNVLGTVNYSYISQKSVGLNSNTFESSHDSVYRASYSYKYGLTKVTSWRIGDSSSGTGRRITQHESKMYGWFLDKTSIWGKQWFGDNNLHVDPPIIENLDWPKTAPYVYVPWWTALSQDIGLQPAIDWLQTNMWDLARIGFGFVDVVVGIAGIPESGGLSIILVPIGMDQMATGIINIITQDRSQSPLEYLGYSAALALGFGENTSQTVGALTPAVLSLLAFSPNAVGYLGRLSATVTFESVGGAGAGSGWTLRNWFRFWNDAGGLTQLEPTGSIPFLRRYRVVGYLNRDLAGTPAYWDTAVHEGTHIFFGRYMPQLVDAGGLPFVGGPFKLINETFAYSLGRIAVGRVHALPFAPIQAFLNGLNGWQQAQVILWAYIGYRFFGN